MDPLATLLAKDQIRDLSGRYMRGLDRRDGALMAGVFWPEATVDYGFFQGAAADFVGFAQEVLASHLANLHLIGQIAIDVEPDCAFGEVYYLAWHRILEAGEPQDLIIAGRYVDRYEPRAGVWKIAHRAELIDWVRAEPAADGFLARIPGALIGGHGAADLSSQRERLRRA